MSQTAFSQDWIKRFTDPFAVLGISVAADERRILKRYRHVAKLLHPDGQLHQPVEIREFTNQVLTRMVNPAYQRLKQDKSRNETLVTLRFKVRRFSREDKLIPQSVSGQKLLTVPEPEVDIFYEQALAKLAAHQYESPSQFEILTQQIGELNLIYLRRKMGDPVIREKRTGLVAATQVKPMTSPPAPPATANDPNMGLHYAQRHVTRAEQYLATKNYAAAIQELKDAVRIDPKNSDFHYLLGRAYWLNRLPGMAKVHIRQALRLNPKHAAATKIAAQLNISVQPVAQPGKSEIASATPNPPPPKRGGFFSKLFSRSR